MTRLERVASIVAVAATLLALGPVVRLGMDLRTWTRYTADLRPAEGAGSGPTAEGFDWVWWTERDGHIEASWVFPLGPGDLAGLRRGDRFYLLEYAQVFDVEDLRSAIRGTPPGRTRSYVVQRDGTHIEASVRLARYPTFLFPRSKTLWYFALWSFGVGAFLHLVGLAVAAPLARLHRRSRDEFLLILLSATWMVANLARMVLVTLFGPPDPDSALDIVQTALAVVGLAGWILFPVLLLHGVLLDTRPHRYRPRDIVRAVLFVPALVLAVAVTASATTGLPEPLTLESLVVPILFYASCTIGAAALVVQIAHRVRSDDADRLFGGWGPWGSLAIATVAFVMALAVIGVLPVAEGFSNQGAGWLLVSAQLLAVVPVTLYSYGTLRHGKLEDMITRALIYLVVLGLIFFAFVAGMSLLEPFFGGRAATRNVVAGLYVVLLLLVADRLARSLRGVSRSFFRSEHERALQDLSRFQERMRDLLDLETLCAEAVEKVARAVRTRSAVLFLKSVESEDRWVSHTFHPEPPYFTENDLRAVWPWFEDDPRPWSANPEIDERFLPEDARRLLLARRAAVAVPIRRDRQSAGLLVLGHKRSTRRVYTLEDLDLLRSIAGQLALAAERLVLVERERLLAREASEAQLLALRSQINPHFLFNALNTIAALIDERPEAAEAVVEHLASIFRFTLQVGERPFVSLEDEIGLVSHYLAIEKARFGETLALSVEVEPGCGSVPVPAFVIQTLVENAVKHGIERQVGGGSVRVTAHRVPGGLSVEVADSGVGIDALHSSGDTSFHGIGLRNVSERLRAHYGRDGLLDLSSEPGSGTVARLFLPVPDSPDPQTP